MNEHVTDHLSAYLDDDLDAVARGTVERHVESCAACARELQALRRLVAYAGAVVSQDAPPASDLWPGIEARLTGANVSTFHPGRGRGSQLRDGERDDATATLRARLERRHGGRGQPRFDARPQVA